MPRITIGRSWARRGRQVEIRGNMNDFPSTPPTPSSASSSSLEASSPDDSELIERVRLALVPGIGPRLAQALLTRFGSATAIFSASRDELCLVEGIGAKLSALIQTGRREIDALEEVELARRSGITLLARERPQYPHTLLEIFDPPSVLYVRGDLLPEDSLSIAIVGSRHATQYGLQLAERFAASLARAGFTIVSGLARGIDAAAHRGALGAGGRTLAVLGSGLLQIYPPEHRDLAADVARGGAVISELPLRVKPLAGTFPQRNRIISGLSLGVLVIEASVQSGALITADFALELGRPVLAVPGWPGAVASEGCNALLRAGAALLEGVEDIRAEMPGAAWRESAAARPVELDGLAGRIHARLAREPMDADRLGQELGEDPAAVAGALALLEVEGVVVRGDGRRFWAAPGGRRAVSRT